MKGREYKEKGKLSKKIPKAEVDERINKKYT
jgi:hypothetical protein